ncbi:GNAT family N-acetyltransferase [Streptosporangium sp. NPDC000396]|uniref:GNAT family N-acetyltransferase n=1 Tax=Streptosporangium sp. NPDC000396 TaxID=3366185 RepID=UPI0036C27B8B
MNTEIVADRIYLTPLAVSDADEMVKVLDGEDLYTFTGGSAPTLDELRARYTRQVLGRSADGLQEWHNWIIRVRDDGQAVGYVQATVMDEGRRAEIAWVVGLPWQGRGYASEAAQAMVDRLGSRGVVSVQAHIHPDHAASAAVARRVGLSPTGLFNDGEQLWQHDREKSP